MSAVLKKKGKEVQLKGTIANFNPLFSKFRAFGMLFKVLTENKAFYFSKRNCVRVLHSARV